MALDNLLEVAPDFSGVVTAGGIPSSFITLGVGVAQGSNQQVRQEIKGADVTVNQSDSPWQIVYGRQRIGGVFTFLQTDQEAGGEYLHVVVTLAGHQINQVLQLILDDSVVTFGGGGIHPGDTRWGSGAYTNLVFMSFSDGDENQIANADLVTQSNILFPGKWTESHRQRGRAHIYLILQFDATVFPQMPVIKADVEGKANIWDPRTGTNLYTANAALCIADYLREAQLGIGAPTSEFDVANLIEAANLCDEVVPQANGNGERRYEVNTTFDSSENPRSVLDKMLTAIGGNLVYTGGLWQIYPATWRHPSVTLTADDLRSPIRVTTKTARRDAFNSIKGTYLSPDPTVNSDGDEVAAWQITDFPPVKNSLYITEDGEQKWEDVTYPCTLSPSCCQRLAKIELERNRQGIVVEAEWGLNAFLLRPCDTVNLLLEDFGWLPKTFEVRELKPNVSSGAEGGGPELTAGLVLKETASGIYFWDSGEETTVDLAPNTSLPDPTVVKAPTGLVLTSGTADLYIRSDGTVFSRIRASWTLAVDPFVRTAGHYDVQFKRSDTSTWLDSTPVSGDSNTTYILDVQDGQYYDVRVRSATDLGYKSGWTTSSGHLVLGKIANPSDVTGFTAVIEGFVITLTWNAIPDLDLKCYEIRYGADWDTAIFVIRTDTTTYRWSPQVIGTYRFMLRAVDTSDHYSTIAAVAISGINKPPEPQISVVLVKGTAVFTWTQPQGGFSIADYEIRYGEVFATAVLVGYAKTTSFTLTVTWGGSRRFWVVARDIAGNLGDAGVTDVIIVPPGQVTDLVADVVDNNVQLRWTQPSTGSLPIDYYLVLRGDTYAGAVPVFEARGTFAPIFEQQSGMFTYWVVPFDSAQNMGTAQGVSAKVNQPPDYILYADQTVDLSLATVVNGAVENGRVIMPFDNSRTWEDHFLMEGWTRPQDQINAGFPIYIQPARIDQPGYLESVIDFGAIFPSSIINLDWLREVIAGTPAVTSSLSYSLDGVTFSTPANATSLLGTNFRYVKLRITATAPDRTSIVAISQVHLKLSVREEDDGGFGTASSSATGGTPVVFNKAFIDVTSLVVTAVVPVGTAYRVHMEYDFVDTANPTSFKVFAYRLDTGARVTSSFSWRARGVVG